MSYLSGVQAKVLSVALLEAFIPERLDELLYFDLHLRRVDITMAGDYQARVFDIIRAGESQGWLPTLVAAAYDARPVNEGLQQTASVLGLTTVTQALESIVTARVPIMDVEPWRHRLLALERQVCRVEIHGPRSVGAGTGFLVGPDLCLTNHHVLEPVLLGAVPAPLVRVVFDSRRTPSGKRVDLERVYTLAPQWLVAARPPSAVDLSPATPGLLPRADELDYALVRLSAQAGRDLIAFDDAGRGLARGWIATSAAEDSGADDPLLCLQHVRGGPLRFAIGTVIGLNANGTRLRHRINTEPGSSGAPCFNARWDLVAMHHAGDPDDGPAHRPECNSAVPVAAIRSDLLACAGIEHVLPPGEPDSADSP